MIQRPASGTLDLELGELTHTGEKSFALSTAVVVQHLQSLLISARLRPLARAVGALAGLQAGSAIRRLLWVLQHPLEQPSFSSAQKRESPDRFGAFCFLLGIKKPSAGLGSWSKLP